jgi:DNA-binding PadR family transcriptional regulator
MGTDHPPTDVLLDRLGRELSVQLTPFLVVSIIHRTHAATPDEIAAELDAMAAGRLDFSQRSILHLLGRLEKTFGLIAREADGGTYILTDRGEALYASTLAQVIAPLRGILPDQS